MSLRNNIVWREGMFLQQQHLQQYERYQNYKLRNVLRYTLDDMFGLENIEINHHYLEQGIISIDSIRCVFPNGFTYDAPNMDSLPPMYSFEQEKSSLTVYIGILNEQANVSNINKYELYSYEHYEVKDEVNKKNDVCEIEVKKLQAYILTDEDDLSNFYVIPIMKIDEVKSNQNIILNKSFIPPYIISYPGSKIYTYLEEVLKLLKTRSDILNNRLSNNNSSESVMISDFMMMQLMNLYITKITDLFNKKRIYTYEIYQTLSELLSQIIIYTNNNRVINNTIKYEYNHLNKTFSELTQQLTHSLSMILEQHAKLLHLQDKGHGLYTANNINDHMFDDQIVLLEIYANQDIDHLKNSIINQIKVSSLHDIKSLVSKGLPGVPLKVLPTAPRQIPYHANHVYIEIDIHSDMWKKIVKENALGIHVSVKYEEFRMQLWTIRI